MDAPACYRANTALREALDAPIKYIVDKLLKQAEDLVPKQFLFIHGCAGSGKSTCAVQLCNRINLGESKKLKRAIYVSLAGAQPLYEHSVQWGKLLLDDMRRGLSTVDKNVEGSAMLQQPLSAVGTLWQMLERYKSGSPCVDAEHVDEATWPLLENLGFQDTKMSMYELLDKMDAIELGAEKVMFVLDEFPAMQDERGEVPHAAARTLRRLLKYAGFRVVVAGTNAKAGNMYDSVSTTSTNLRVGEAWVTVFPLSTLMGNLVSFSDVSKGLEFMCQANPRLAIAVCDEMKSWSFREFTAALDNVRTSFGGKKNIVNMERGCVMMLMNNLYSEVTSTVDGQSTVAHGEGHLASFIHSHYAVPKRTNPYKVIIQGEHLVYDDSKEKWHVDAVYDAKDILLQMLFIHPTFMTRPARVVVDELLSSSSFSKNAVQSGNDGNALEMLGCVAMCLASIDEKAPLSGVPLPQFFENLAYHLYRGHAEEGKEEQKNGKTAIPLPACFREIRVPRYTPPNVDWPSIVGDSGQRGTFVEKFERARNIQKLDATARGLAAEMKDWATLGATELLPVCRKLEEKNVNIVIVRNLTSLATTSKFMSYAKRNGVAIVVARANEQGGIEWKRENPEVSCSRLFVIFVVGE
jgi:hypothetical protein